jgi:phosphohistidine phosphatase SixA
MNSCWLRLLLWSSCLLAGAPAAADPALWTLLHRGGQVVLIRHAQTVSGVGDPPEFKLGDCSTQRNLSEEGRQDARALGEAFRSRQVPVARLVSSPWCRCLETARLAFGREGEVETALSNLFGRPQNEAAQVARLKTLVGRPVAGGNLVMLTHGSVIHALTGISPASGEMVVVTPQGDGRFAVAGRLQVKGPTAPGTPTTGRP